MCREHHNCPTGDERFDGCENHICAINDMFDNTPNEMGCNGCKDGWHKMDYKFHAEICITDDHKYDCQATATTTSGANTGFPQGPEGCTSCVMVGQESLC